MKYRVTLWNKEEIVDEFEDRLEDKVFNRCDSHVSFVSGGPNLNFEHDIEVERLIDQVMATKETIGKYEGLPRTVWVLWNKMTERVVFSHPRYWRVVIKHDHYSYQWMRMGRENPFLMEELELNGPWPEGSGSC